eukprot:Hpha_TRINITY_DN26462_c0_g1::TRINITY_DN26462_c0_g1_i1::g.34069::m.34069
MLPEGTGPALWRTKTKLRGRKNCILVGRTKGEVAKKVARRGLVVLVERGWQSPSEGVPIPVPLRAPERRKKAAAESEELDAPVPEPRQGKRVVFKGFAEWAQRSMPGAEQDKIMHRACRAAFGSDTRACFWSEYSKGLMKGAPKTNTATYSLCFAGEGSGGSGGPASKKCVSPGAPLNGSSDNPFAAQGTRVAVAVSEAK